MSEFDPKNPFAASIVWQSLHWRVVRVLVESAWTDSSFQRFAPICWLPWSVLSRFRTGFGGIRIWSAKSAYFCMSDAEIIPSRPTRPGNATMKFRNDRSSSQGDPFGFAAQESMPKKPLARSPRECSAPCVASPRNVCVTIGPFIGWNRVWAPLPWCGCGFVVTTSSGLPRSQPRASRSPNKWQLEHEASPLPEVRTAS